MNETSKEMPRTIDRSIDYSDQDLQKAFSEFMQETSVVESKPNPINIATISGIAVLAIVSLFVLQTIMPFVPGIVSEGFMRALPMISGILVTVTGMGYLVGERRRIKKMERQRKRMETVSDYQDFASTRTSRSSLKTERETTRTAAYDSEDRTSVRSRHTSPSSSQLEEYAMRQNKKLFRARRDKKIFGVCGGLGKYLGISPTMIRLAFAISFFISYGTTSLVYILMSFVIPKEPKSLRDYHYEFENE